MKHSNFKSRFLILLLGFLTIGISQVWGATVSYSPSSTTAVSQSGTAPQGSSATFSTTYTDKNQLTSEKAQTLTLSGFDGCKITGIKLNIKKTNGDKNLQITAKVGEEKFVDISAFSDIPTSAGDKTITLSSTPIVGSNEKVEIYCKASANSIYIYKYEITYEVPDPFTVSFFSVNGTKLQDITETSGGVGVTTPAAQTTTCSDWTFAGWTTDNVTTETSEVPSKLTAENAVFHPTSNCNMYPVFKRQGSERVPMSKEIAFSDLSTSPYSNNDFTVAWSSSVVVGASGTGFKGNSANMTFTVPSGIQVTSIGVHNSNTWGAASLDVYAGTSTSGTKCGSMTTTTKGTSQSVSITGNSQSSTSFYMVQSVSSKNAWVDKVTISYKGYPYAYLKNPVCAPTYAITTNNPANGSIKFSTDGTNWSNTIADQEENADVYFKLVPNAGYEISGTPTVSNVSASDITDFGEGIYGFTMPAAPVIVSATFVQPATYIILYDKGSWTSAEGDVPDPDEVTPGTNYTVSTDELSLTGYTFKGWNTDKNATTGLTNITVNDDITLYAIFTINSYNVTFNPSITGGSIKVNGSSTSPVQVQYNSNVTIAVTTTTHYELTTLTYNGTDIKTDKSFQMPADNVEIAYSFTEDQKVIVTFKNNDNTLATGGTREVYVGDPIGTLPTLTSSDAKDARSKTFVGWTEDKVEVWQPNKPTLIDASTIISEAKILNAVWAKGDGKYQQITSESELIAGNKYVIQNDSKVIAHNSTPALIQNEVALTEVDGKLTPEARHLWILAGSVDDGWSFVIDDSHKLSTQGSGTDLTLTGNNTLWAIWNIGETQSSSATPQYNTDDYFWIFQSDNSKDYYIEYSNSKWITYGISNTSWPTTGQNGYIKIKLYTSSLTDYITHSSASPLASITLNTDNVKKNYFVGETFTSANLSATAKLEDGIEFPIEYNDLTISTPDLTSAGETVTVSYTFNGATKSAPYTVNAYSVTVNPVYTDRVNEESVTGNTYSWNPETHALTFTKQSRYQFNGITNVVGADKTGSNLSYTLSNPTANVTLTATWQRLFTLTYNGKGGSTPDAVEDKTKGTPITLSSSSWAGYDFVGWYDNEAYDGTALTSPYTITADATIYAKWSEITPASISLSPDVTAIELIYDGSATEKAKKITATVTPSTALDKTFAWSVVEGSDVVEVANDGTISALKAGSAKVKVASSRDANIYKEISVTVHALPQITWLNMDGTQFGETTKGTSAGKVGTMPSGIPTSCDTEKYPYFRGWSATNFGKTTDNPESSFVTKDTEVALDGEYTFYAVCAAAVSGGEDSWELTGTTFDILDDSQSSGYSKYNGTHTLDDYTYVSNQMMKTTDNPAKVQFQKNAGKMYNKTSFGSITKIELTGSDVAAMSVYPCTTETSSKPTSGNITPTTSGSTNTYTFSGTNGYFILGEFANSKTPKLSSIKVYYVGLAYTEWATQCCQAPEHELAITTTALTVKMGNTLQLSTGETGNGNTIKWESKNTAVATVDQSGLVTPFGTGKATITVSQEAKTVDNVDYCEQYAEVEVEVIANDEFGISFTAAEGGSAVAKINDAITQKATTDTTVTIVATESSSDYIFDSWTVVSGGVSLTSTTANPTTFVMGSADVEITPTFYKKTVDNIAIKTAPSVTSYTTRDHLNVTGLVITANYTKHGSEDIAYAGNEDKFSFSPALDANLTAGNQQDVTVTYDGKSTTFKIDVAQYTTPYYSLVTDASQLEAGKKVVFGTKEADKVMGYYVDNANNILGVDATYNEQRTGVEVDDVAYIVSGNATEGWHFADAQGRYIYAAGSSAAADKENYLKADATKQSVGTWTISIDATTNILTMNCTGSSANRKLFSYNSTQQIPSFFSCYSTTQKAVYMYIEDVKPVYVPVTSIELNETAMNVMQSKSGSLVATVGPDNATQHNVTWSIINDNANGKITVTEAGTVLVDEEAAVGATATVRATTDGTDKDGNHLTAECVITVTELETIDYMLVTTASLLQAGDIIVLGNADNSALNGAIGTGDYFEMVSATYNSAKKTMSSKHAVEITLGGNAIDGWTFTTYEGNIFADASEDIEVSTTKDPSVWTIAIAADGTATIKAEGEGYAIRYNTTAPRFKRYQQGSGATIQIYSKRDTRYKRTDLVVGNYGTLCVPYAVKATDRSGATFWNIETSNAIGSTNPTSVTIVQEEGDLVAGKPYIFCAIETEMAMFFSGDKYEESESVPANGLYGNLTDANIIINPTEYVPGYFFVLQQKLYECGVNCTVGPNRGWVQAAEIQNLTTPSPAPRRVIGNPNGTPTGIHNLNVDGWVDLQGAHKYFQDNHIVIVNEGRIYNAQGIEVQ